MLKGETINSGASPRCEDCGITPQLQVCRSAAGWYVGTECECGPYSRETGYFKTYELAKAALDGMLNGRTDEFKRTDEFDPSGFDITIL